MIGKRIGPHQITSLVGRGSTGAVYRAVHLEDQREVAIKALHEEISSLGGVRARVEKTMETLNEDGRSDLIVPYAIHEQDGRLFLIQDFVKGKCLSLFLSELTTKTEIWQALPLFVSVATAVAHVHSRGLLCGNVRPCNILLCESSRGVTIKLSDVGLFPIDSAGRLASVRGEEIVNFAVYLAPEVLNQKALPSQRSDIFSLGATLYHLVTGWPPRIGLDLKSLRKSARRNLEAPRNLRPDLPKELELALLTATSNEPNIRYRDVESLLEVLGPLEPSSNKALASLRGEREPTRESEEKAEAQTLDFAAGGHSEESTSDETKGAQRSAPPGSTTGRRSRKAVMLTDPNAQIPSDGSKRLQVAIQSGGVPRSRQHSKRTISGRARTQPLIPDDKLTPTSDNEALERGRKTPSSSHPKVTPTSDEQKAQLSKIAAIRNSFSSLDRIPKVDLPREDGPTDQILERSSVTFEEAVAVTAPPRDSALDEERPKRAKTPCVEPFCASSDLSPPLRGSAHQPSPQEGPDERNAIHGEGEARPTAPKEDHDDTPNRETLPPKKSKPFLVKAALFVIPLAVGVLLSLWIVSIYTKKDEKNRLAREKTQQRASSQQGEGSRLGPEMAPPPRAGESIGGQGNAPASSRTDPRARLTNPTRQDPRPSEPRARGAREAKREMGTEKAPSRKARPRPTVHVSIRSIKAPSRWKRPLGSAVARRIGSFRRCVRSTSQGTKPGTQGRVRFRVLFGDSGSVVSALVLHSSLPSPRSESCVQRVAKKLRAKGLNEVVNATVELHFKVK